MKPQEHLKPGWTQSSQKQTNQKGLTGARHIAWVVSPCQACIKAWVWSQHSINWAQFCNPSTEVQEDEKLIQSYVGSRRPAWPRDSIPIKKKKIKKTHKHPNSILYWEGPWFANENSRGHSIDLLSLLSENVPSGVSHAHSNPCRKVRGQPGLGSSQKCNVRRSQDHGGYIRRSSCESEWITPCTWAHHCYIAQRHTHPTTALGRFFFPCELFLKDSLNEKCQPTREIRKRSRRSLFTKVNFICVWK